MSRSVQAVLILVQLLFVATLVGAVSALSTASSVDAVDGHLFGLLLLYTSSPGVGAFVLSLCVRTGGVGVWRGARGPTITRACCVTRRRAVMAVVFADRRQTFLDRAEAFWRKGDYRIEAVNKDEVFPAVYAVREAGSV
ncbi:hypothetical protein [Streptomyces cyaneofuscatus]|uniref:Uncharacterized protein n=1 Tax=Streptomyces cyaneofuscatus TaxID=66883 RepID=A0ABZ1EYR9_9ACTN|nr:hypothetical protein [Streptomyces cyaneofuscatus]WSB09180.1 hypothetical protein OG849_19020 [Streptomyces cyaneofuscatus]WSD47284.1 hypothetical protein OG857_16380 [Streptomyces cyaneofuscatus]